MADSPAHRWGQIIGDMLEKAVHRPLREFAQLHGFYLDARGPRPARKTVDVIWEDTRGNKHKLDYVLERGGTQTHIGTPAAFVEIAWRRYTKHSKNKAQEIEAAIQPLIVKHELSGPFFGAILAGEFTTQALDQLRSANCEVLYFPYLTVIEAFKTVGIDATTEESTPEYILAEKVSAWDVLPNASEEIVADKLLQLNAGAVDTFMETLRAQVARQVTRVQVFVLHGQAVEFVSVAEALVFVERYSLGERSYPFAKYEIEVNFDNGNVIRGIFHDTTSAVQFLQLHQPPQVRPAEDDGEHALTIDKLLADGQ